MRSLNNPLPKRFIVQIFDILMIFSLNGRPVEMGQGDDEIKTYNLKIGMSTGVWRCPLCVGVQPAYETGNDLSKPHSSLKVEGETRTGSRNHWHR